MTERIATDGTADAQETYTAQLVQMHIFLIFDERDVLS
jgi:hypothetical protein